MADKIDRAALSEATSLGIQIAAIMGICFFAGFKMDKYFGTIPLFTLIMSALGFAASIYFVVKSVKNK